MHVQLMHYYMDGIILICPVFQHFCLVIDIIQDNRYNLIYNIVISRLLLLK